MKTEQAVWLDSLDSMLAKLDERACVEFFKGMTEKDRKQYAERALLWLDVSRLHNENQLRWWETVNIGSAPKNIQKLYREKEEAKVAAKSMPPQAVKAEAMPVAQLAALAACTLTEIKKRRQVAAQLTHEVLKDRNPKWLPEYCEWLLNDPGIHWRAVRALEKEGIFAPKLTANYYRGFLLAATEHDLRTDPSLVDRFWESVDDDGAMRLLLMQPSTTVGRNMLDDNFQERWRLQNDVGQKWVSVLEALAGDGLIEKQRLMQSLMDVYVRFNLEHSDSKSAIVESRVEHLHVNLNLTQEQRLEMLLKYLQLLNCRNPRVVLWSLKCLQELVAAPDFPAQYVCEIIPTVFLLKGKEHAVEALKLLKDISDRAPDMVPVVARATAEGLNSESQDVQKRSLVQLEKLKYKDDELCELIAAKIDSIGAVHRERAMKFCGAAINGAGDEAHVEAGQCEEEAHRDAREDVPRPLHEIPEHLAKILGDDPLAAITFRGDDIPRLSDETRLPLLGSLDDLIFMASQILHGAYPRFTCDDVEVLLDGIARFGCERPSDYEQRTQALRAQLHPWQASDALCAGIYAWLTGKSNQLMPTFGGYDPWTACDKEMQARFVSVAARAFSGKSTTLLSTPTHKSGWIDARVLVQRVRRLQNASDGVTAKRGILNAVLSTIGVKVSEPVILDQALSLLRLAPDARSDALRELNSFNLNRTEFVDALRYALGAEDVRIGDTTQLWVAAARARNPFGDDSAVNAKHPGTGPDGACVAKYKLAYRVASPADANANKRSFSLQWERKFRMVERLPAMPTDSKIANMLPVIRHNIRIVMYANTRLADWQRSIFPMNCDAYFAHGFERMVNHDGNDSIGRENTVFMQPLYEELAVEFRAAS